MLLTPLNPTPDAQDSFGAALASLAENLLIGAPGEDAFGVQNAGAAYLFYGPPAAGIVSVSTADAMFIGADPFEHAGWWVAPAGDSNNDGLDDFVVGAPANNSSTGVAYLLTRSGQ